MTRNLAILSCVAAAGLFVAGCRSGSNCQIHQPSRGDAVPQSEPKQAVPHVHAQGAQGHSGVAATPYGGQKTCPVMGEELGAHGSAIPVAIRGQTVYVCCRGCVGKVRADPDKYLAIVNAERNPR